MGLVGTDKGFFARDIDIEPHDRKKCLVPLTDDPAKVIDFLGLDSKYWIPRNSTRGDDTTSSAVVQFKDTTELFRAIAGMRFFDVGAYVKKDLKGNDKIRVGTRDAFRTFVDDFLPSLVEEEGRIETSAEEEEKGVRRAEVFQEALTHWNKFDEWVQMKRAWDYDRIEALTRRSAKEEKRYATLEEDQYIKSWLEWCGYTTIQIK